MEGIAHYPFDEGVGIGTTGDLLCCVPDVQLIEVLLFRSAIVRVYLH